MWNRLENYRDFGLLVLRIGLGAMFIYHGYPKLMGGPALWHKLGEAVGYFGIKIYPEIFGFLAAASESFGGVFLILGLFFRPACLFLMFTMIVASTHHLAGGDDLNTASHAIELAFVFFGLLFVGPGSIAIGAKRPKRIAK